MGKNLKGKEIGVGFSQRKDGRYEARFTNRSGERVRLYGEKLPELRRRFRKAQYEDEHGINGTEHNVTVKEWATDWMPRYKKHIRDVTKNSYLSKLNIVIKYLGDRKLTSVKQMHVQDMVNILVDQGYAASTIKGVKSIAYNIFEMAYNNDLIKSNPVKNVDIHFADSRDEIGAFTLKEQEMFYESIEGSHYYEMFAFMLQTGLRIGEVLGLRWIDVDWEKQELSIVRNLVYTKVNGRYQKMMEKTKTSNSSRTIPLTDEAIRLLKAQKGKGLNEKSNNNLFPDMIFVGQNGNSCTDHNVRRILKSKEKQIRKKYPEIGSIHPHKLRHSFSSRCMESGMNIKTVSKLLGHKKIDTTADIYLDVQKEYAADEIKKLSITGFEDVGKEKSSDDER